MCSYIVPAESPADTPATRFIMHRNERSRWPQAVLLETHVTRTEVTQRVYNVAVRYFYSLNLNSKETLAILFGLKGSAVLGHLHRKEMKPAECV